MNTTLRVGNFTMIGYGYRWRVYKYGMLVGTFMDTSINIRTDILTGKIR